MIDTYSGGSNFIVSLYSMFSKVNPMYIVEKKIQLILIKNSSREMFNSSLTFLIRYVKITRRTSSNQFQLR
jgi:hypothetical protein